jgi:hypothetical protein
MARLVALVEKIENDSHACNRTAARLYADTAFQ